MSSLAQHFQNSKMRKNLLNTAAEHFNRSPKEGYVIKARGRGQRGKSRRKRRKSGDTCGRCGRQSMKGDMGYQLTFMCRFEFLKANKLADPADHRSVAMFLKTTPRLDKTLVGGFLGKRDNVPITKEYPFITNI